MEVEILKVLEDAGLTQGEAKTYLALVSLGQSTVGPIVDKAGVSASKVYLILDRLVNKGLASMSVEQGVKLFAAAPPEQILTFLENEKSRIEDDINGVNRILPMLKAKIESAGKYPLIEYARGPKGFETLYMETFSKATKGDKYVALGGLDISFKMQGYWYKQSVIMAEKKIETYLLYEDSVWHKKDPKIHRRKERKMYYPRVLDKKYKSVPNIMTLGDTTALTGIEDGEIFTLLIRNKNLTNNFRKLIKIMWDSAKVPEGFKKKELKID